MNYQQQVLNLLKEQAQSIKELEQAVGIEGADDYKALVKDLVILEQTGKIKRTKNDRYIINYHQIEGTLSQNKKGFGFVRPTEDTIEDIFIAPNEIKNAMDGDTVLVEVIRGRGGKDEGIIKEITKRAVTQVVGTYTGAKHFGFVIPDDKHIQQDIFIPKNQNLGAIDGHKVIVELTKYPDGESNPEGIVKAILGHKNDPGVDILSIIYAHGINIEFTEAALKQAQDVPDEISKLDREGRTDLRDVLTITIDGADAKDLDDAISVQKLSNGHFKLIVSIADVSYYVTEGSPLDNDAYERGTSVYLVDRVIPMIPHRLSNGICSLNPNEDRLAMSCEMEFDATGKVVHHKIYESVIHSDERMTYDEVNLILEQHDNAVMNKYSHLTDTLFAAQELNELLINQRQQRGEVDFDFKEAKVLVNAEGVPYEVAIRNRGLGERLIESFMLAANETVAEHFHRMDVPFIYRIHEEPKPEKIKRFFEFITNFGIVVSGETENIHPKTLQKIAQEIKGQPEELVISTLMLRSMQQAKYSEASLGHFGLSAEYYTHFTSPIRRYPDLIVHRLIRKYLIEHSIKQQDMDKLEEQLVEISEHTSKRERRAVDAERATDALKKAEFMVQHIGEEYEGIISSVAGFGMFVELENTIEGMVHNTNLTDDYYRFDDRSMSLIGERTAKVFKIGDKVKVKVLDVNVDERMIDFSIVGMTPRETSRKAVPVHIKAKEARTNTQNKPRKKGRGKAKATNNKPFYKAKGLKTKRKKK